MNIKALAKKADNYADTEINSDEDLEDVIWCKVRDKKFAELVAAHERKACAKLCDANGLFMTAREIRERGKA